LVVVVVPDVIVPGVSVPDVEWVIDPAGVFLDYADGGLDCAYPPLRGQVFGVANGTGFAFIGSCQRGTGLRQSVSNGPFQTVRAVFPHTAYR